MMLVPRPDVTNKRRPRSLMVAQKRDLESVEPLGPPRQQKLAAMHFEARWLVVERPGQRERGRRPTGARELYAMSPTKYAGKM